MSYELYKAELAEPTPADKRSDVRMDFINSHPNDAAEHLSGFWRIVGSKMKADYPVAIYTQEGHTVFAIGAEKRPMVADDTTPIESREDKKSPADLWFDFTTGGWLKCLAVTRKDWDIACDTKFWPDGKPARLMSQEEKLGISTEQSGGNAAPVEETLADQIEALADKLNEVAEPTTQEQADALTGDLDRMRALLKRADTERETEYRPHKKAADAVSQKWADIMKPGQDAGTSAEAKRKAYLKKVQAALDAAAEAERKRLAKEAEDKRKAAEAAAQEAAAKGEEPPPVVEPEPVPVVEAKRASAGTSFGRQSGLKRVKVGKIVNLQQMIAAMLFDDSKEPDADLMAYLQERANKAAKGGFPLPGTRIDEEYR